MVELVLDYEPAIRYHKIVRNLSLLWRYFSPLTHKPVSISRYQYSGIRIQHFHI